MAYKFVYNKLLFVFFPQPLRFQNGLHRKIRLMEKYNAFKKAYRPNIDWAKFEHVG
jgi:hypothetical protein